MWKGKNHQNFFSAKIVTLLFRTNAENVKKMSDESRFSLFLKLNILEENFDQGIKIFYFISDEM
jgi:hypothetical protein